MNPSFSSINEIPITQSLPNNSANITPLAWKGKTVYALYVPKEAIIPNTHPELLAKNNNDYTTTFDVSDRSFAEIDLTSSQLLFNGGNFSGSFGNAIISEQYCFDFATHTLHNKKYNFSHTMATNEKINIIALKSTFIKKDVQFTEDRPPSYDSLFPSNMVGSWV